MASTDTPAQAAGPVAARYNELATYRNIYLQRARDAARLTLPYLLPPFDLANAGTLYPTPWQSVGARGTNNLASKLLMALFPPNASFLRMMIQEDKEIRKAMAADESFKSELDAGLAAYEDSISTFVESSNSRPSFFEAFKQLIVTGNSLLYCKTEDTSLKPFRVRVFRMDHYVVKRAPNGIVLEIITSETTTPAALPTDVQEACDLINLETATEDKPFRYPEVTIYTHIKRVDGKDKYEVVQEINSKEVPGSQGDYPAKKLPWIALRWAKMDNEDYGRGFIEEYIGDLKSLDALRQSATEAAAIMAKMVPLINPNGTVRAKDLTSKGNGEPIIGMPTDVHFLQVEKFPDLKFVMELIGVINQNLEQAFLLNSSIQRQAERVTAEEVKVMAGELEDSMGGIYSLFGQELQLPFAHIVIAEMEKQALLPKLPKGAASPCIITGLEALGRGNDLQRLSTFVQGAAQDLGPNVIQQYVQVGEYFRRRATALNIDPTGLIKSDQDVQAAQAAAQKAQMVNRIAPAAVTALGKHTTETQKQAMIGQQQKEQAASGAQE